MTASLPADGPPEVAWLRVVRGHPSPRELAVLVTVVSALETGARSTAPAPKPTRSPWVGRSGPFRRRLPTPGEGSWQQAYLP